MKKSTFLFAWMMLLASLFSTQASSSFAGGEGTVESPYKIETAVQLDSVRWHMDSHFILMNDIDLSAAGYPVFRPLGKRESTEPSNSFTAFNGTFDGQGHVISGINIIYAGNYVGLFAVVGGEIRNLGVKGTVNHNGNGGGLLAGYLGQTTVAVLENCFAEGTVVQAGDAVTNGQAAVLCGVETKTNSIIKNCYAAGSVSSTSTYVGGITGRVMNAGGMLMNCYSTADVTGTDYVGGITGQIYGNNVNYTYATGKVTGSSNVGGITGNVVANSGTTGHIAANTSISAASAPVGRVTGGLAGTVEAIYGLSGMDIKLNGVAQGVTSNIYSKDGGNVSLEDLQSSDFYENEIGWDFETDWTMPATAGLPILKWQTGGSGSGISPVSENSVTAFFYGNLLHIREIKAPNSIKVFTLTGQLVKTAENVTGDTVFIIPGKGIYIVALASPNHTQTIKVIHK